MLALGSNLGDRAGTLAAAVLAIGDIPGLVLTGVSPVYQSVAVTSHGVDASAPRYLNSVVTAAYTGDPHALLRAVNGIESDHGRVRAERWGDRTLDIDIIAVGADTMADADLTLPHPRAADRDFVLVPWLDLDAEAVLPGRGPVSGLLAAIGSTVQQYRAPTADAPTADAPTADALTADALTVRGGVR